MEGTIYSSVTKVHPGASGEALKHAREINRRRVGNQIVDILTNHESPVVVSIKEYVLDNPNRAYEWYNQFQEVRIEVTVTRARVHYIAYPAYKKYEPSFLQRVKLAAYNAKYRIQRAVRSWR